MADFNKIGLLLLNEDKTKFMVCEKDHFTTDYILPGGRIEAGEDDITCLKREIQEELACDVDIASLEFIGEYEAPASGAPDKTVSIRLYRGGVIGTPKPSNEIVAFYWIGKGDLTHPRISPIIRNLLLPDLIERKILE